MCQQDWEPVLGLGKPQDSCPQLEEESSAPSHAQQINVDVLNLVCPDGAKIKRPRESTGSEWFP